MSPKERLRRQLVTARETSERYLEDFKTPEAWTAMVHKGANHALWFVGHMANTDNFFISIVAPEQAVKRAGFAEKFGVGSHPTSDPNDYPSVEEVLAFMRERRAVLLGIFDLLTEEDFARATPEGTPSFLADIGSVFEMAVWHEGLHSGQLSVTRRSLGFDPAFR
ncbi:MAG: DinB family protein [Planctomycetaceae bacterium]|nr:DinB family protein [Planctomycetales bacterium]MCB9927690.1 DinB family protein [Planctomycetaceae bacterium]